MAWYDSLISGLNTAGNLWNAASPLINTGASLYNRNQTQGAISNAFQDYAGYVNQGLDKYQGFVDQGLSKYADYTKSAMDDYKLASQEGIGAIKDVQGALSSAYSTSLGNQAPYTRAGKQAVSGYQSLLQDPSKIVDDPGYQFRFDQGAEAQRRNAAATGFRGSGNQQIALTEYGQNYATNEFDRSLSRYTPLIQAGVQAAGNVVNAGSTYSAGMANTGNSLAQMYDSYGRVSAGMQQGLGAANAAAYQGLGQAYSGAYEGLGDAAAGSQVGQAGADTAFLRDVLGMDVNPLSAAGSAAGGVRDLLTGAPAASGAASATVPSAPVAPGVGVGAGVSGATAGAINSLGASAGAQGAAAFVPGGTGAAAMAPGGQGMAAMFPGSGGSLATGGTTAANVATQQGAQSLAASSPTLGSWLGSVATGMAPLMAVAALSNMQGGAADKSKTGDLFSEFQRDPAAGYQKLDKVITNQEWVGETDTNLKYAINPAFEQGVIDVNYPTLHSSQSVVDLWSAPSDKVSPVAVAQSFGLDKQTAQQYSDLQKERKAAASDYGVAGAFLNTDRVEQADHNLRMFEASYFSPQAKQQTAQRIYTDLRQNGYQGDLGKIERYLNQTMGGNMTSPGNMSTTYLP